MPRTPTVILSVLLATVLHVDWHLARPHHYRLSLEWSEHWLATAAAFLVVGCVIARFWPDHRWRMAVTTFLAAVVLAQVLEPMLEVILYEGRFGYASEPARWAAFWQAISAGALAMALGLLCARRPLPLRAG